MILAIYRSRLANMYLYVILSVSCMNRNENNQKHVLRAGSCMWMLTTWDLNESQACRLLCGKTQEETFRKQPKHVAFSVLRFLSDFIVHGESLTCVQSGHIYVSSRTSQHLSNAIFAIKKV